MNIELQYLDLLKELVNKSNEKVRDDRTGTGTYGVFGRMLKHNMQSGFPLLTTKKMAISQIKSELIWFMKGQTDLRTLLEQKNYIWVGDAYKFYLNNCNNIEENEKTSLKKVENHYEPFTKLEFIEKILEDDVFSATWGDLGPIYGYQWRNWGDEHDQLNDLVSSLKENPYSRRQIVNSWNVSDIGAMTLPPCHLYFQVHVEDMSNQEKKLYKGYEKKLNLMWVQRSCDTLLGIPFNIASYAMLLEVLGKLTGYLPWELTGMLGDTHLYSNHIEPAKLQLSNEPFELPTISFADDLDFSSLDNFLNSYYPLSIQINDYISHSKIEAELSN